MVARAELVAARAEAKAKAGEAAALEAQLARRQEQLREAQASLGEMVSRTELAAVTRKLNEAVARLEAADEAARSMSERHRDAVSKMQEALGAKEEEARCLQAKIQVCGLWGLESSFARVWCCSVVTGFLCSGGRAWCRRARCCS
jgi:chromosome segregation ATPase